MEEVKQKQKGRQRRLLFVAGCVVVYALLVGIIWNASAFVGAIQRVTKVNDMKNTKLVLYEGPKSLKDATTDDLEKKAETQKDISLKHCVDTKVTVNGSECFV